MDDDHKIGPSRHVDGVGSSENDRGSDIKSKKGPLGWFRPSRNSKHRLGSQDITLRQRVDNEDEGAIGSVANAVTTEYRTYKRRWFGLIQLTLMNIIVSWDVSLIYGTSSILLRKGGGRGLGATLKC